MTEKDFKNLKEDITAGQKKSINKKKNNDGALLGSVKAYAQRRANNIRQAGMLGSIPTVLAAGPLVGYFIGKYLDGLAGTEPFLTIFFIVMGMVAAIRNIIDILNKDKK